MFGGGDMGSMLPKDETLVINRSNKLVKALIASMKDKEKDEDRELLVRQIYDIAMLSHRPLEPEAMTAFVKRTLQLMEKII